MHYAVLVFIDTELTPQTIVNEVVSNLDFDNQEVTLAIVFDNGRQVAVYYPKEERK